MNENDFTFGGDADAFLCVCGKRYLAKMIALVEEGEPAFRYVDWFEPEGKALLECPCGMSLEARHAHLLGQWETVICD